MSETLLACPGGDSNPTRARYTRYRQAFETVLTRLFIPNRFESHPLRCCLPGLDINSEYRRWTFDSVIIAADVEKAIRKALDDDPILLEKLFDWVIAPEIEPGIDPPILSLDETKLYTKIQQSCGREFIRRGLYPLHRYFNMPANVQRILNEEAA